MPTVLVVGASIAVREILEAMLEDEGYTIVAASSIRVALDTLYTTTERMVALLDTYPPDGTLLDLLRAVDADGMPSQRHAYVGLSASSPPAGAEDDEEWALVARYDVRMLYVPFNAEELIRAVGEAAQRLAGAN